MEEKPSRTNYVWAIAAAIVCLAAVLLQLLYHRGIYGFIDDAIWLARHLAYNGF